MITGTLVRPDFTETHPRVCVGQDVRGRHFHQAQLTHSISPREVPRVGHALTLDAGTAVTSWERRLPSRLAVSAVAGPRKRYKAGGSAAGRRRMRGRLPLVRDQRRSSCAADR